MPPAKTPTGHGPRKVPMKNSIHVKRKKDGGVSIRAKGQVVWVVVPGLVVALLPIFYPVLAIPAGLLLGAAAGGGILIAIQLYRSGKWDPMGQHAANVFTSERSRAGTSSFRIDGSAAWLGVAVVVLGAYALFSMLVAWTIPLGAGVVLAVAAGLYVWRRAKQPSGVPVEDDLPGAGPE
jgi:hypothetical protein